MSRPRVAKQARRSVERREESRVAARLPAVLVDDARTTIASTHNLSASGAYCTLRRSIPLMTRLQVRFQIPGHPRSTQIICQGVVVRVEPPVPTPRRTRYKVAIFFNDMTDGDRAVIARYVQQQLHKTKRRG